MFHPGRITPTMPQVFLELNSPADDFGSLPNGGSKAVGQTITFQRRLELFGFEQKRRGRNFNIERNQRSLQGCAPFGVDRGGELRWCSVAAIFSQTDSGRVDRKIPAMRQDGGGDGRIRRTTVRTAVRSAAKRNVSAPLNLRIYPIPNASVSAETTVTLAFLKQKELGGYSARHVLHSKPVSFSE